MAKQKTRGPLITFFKDKNDVLTCTLHTCGISLKIVLSHAIASIVGDGHLSHPMSRELNLIPSAGLSQITVISFMMLECTTRERQDYCYVHIQIVPICHSKNEMPSPPDCEFESWNRDL